MRRASHTASTPSMTASLRRGGRTVSTPSHRPLRRPRRAIFARHETRISHTGTPLARKAATLAHPTGKQPYPWTQTTERTSNARGSCRPVGVATAHPRVEEPRIAETPGGSPPPLLLPRHPRSKPETGVTHVIAVVLQLVGARPCGHSITCRDCCERMQSQQDLRTGPSHNRDVDTGHGHSPRHGGMEGAKYFVVFDFPPPMPSEERRATGARVRAGVRWDKVACAWRGPVCG